MAEAVLIEHSDRVDVVRRQVFKRVTLLSVAATVVCAALIIMYADWADGSVLAEVSTLLEAGIRVFLPYMLSAVVAAITAIAIMAILPAARDIDPAEHILGRLRDLNAGNLATRMSLPSGGQFREIAYELNQAVGNLNQQVSTLKVVNRQQWELLGDIRSSVESGNSQLAIQCLDEMEKNWGKIAEIEKGLMT